MSTPEQGWAGDEDTVILHLGRFAHGAPAGAGAVYEDGGETEVIRRAAVEAVSGLDKPVVVPKAAAPLSPDEMLGAVAYCYVRGVFSSDDIERKMLRDLEFREALDGVVPDPATIRRFRRLNREAIQIVLENFYAYLRQQNKDVRRLGCAPPDVATVGGAQLVSRREAMEQLDRAAFVDAMSDF